MPRAEEPAAAANQRKRKSWGPADARREAVEKGAVVLPLQVHSATMDELDLRRE